MSVGSPTAGTWSSSPWRPDNEFETDREQPLAPTLFRRFANLGRFVAPYAVGIVRASDDVAQIEFVRLNRPFDQPPCTVGPEDS